MSGGTAGVRGTGAECRKFAPNIFNKSKCSSCFKQKEEHSAEALECNRVSFAWWTLYLSLFLSFSPLRIFLTCSYVLSLFLLLSSSSSLSFVRCVSIFVSVLRVRTRFIASRHFVFLARSRIFWYDPDQAEGWKSCSYYVRWTCTMNAISPRNERFSADTVPTSLFSFRRVHIAVRFSYETIYDSFVHDFVDDYLAIKFYLYYYDRHTRTWY